MGIDPGTAVTGYGVIHISDGRVSYISHGEIRIRRGIPLSRCLSDLYDQLAPIIRKAEPAAIALEDIFYGKNVKSLIKQGHARGVIILAAAQAGIPLYEYSPLEVKKAVVGYGRAEKRQVQHMVKACLALQDVVPPDASDALAVAICHAHHHKTDCI